MKMDFLNENRLKQSVRWSFKVKNKMDDLRGMARPLQIGFN